MKRRILLAVVINVALAVAASAQSPERLRQQQPRAEQQRDTANQRGTAEQPLIVRVIPADADQPETAEQRRERQRQATTDLWLIMLTGGLVAAAAAQAWFAGVATRGLKYARRSAEAAETNINTIKDTAKAQLRPYVYVERAEVSNVKSPGPVIIHIFVKNGGVTPAYDMTHQTGSRFRPSDFNEFSLPQDIPRSKGTMGPGVVVESTLEVARDAWNERAGGLMDGSTVLTVLGEIRYTDSFADQHITKYRYWLLPGPLRDGTLAVCQEGNSAT